MQEKHDAFAAALEELAIRPRDFPNITKNYVIEAKAGLYADGNRRPAFLGSYFRMTEQEWDALWALIYG